MSIIDEIAATDAAAQAEVDAILAEIKDAHGRLTAVVQAWETSKNARQAQVDRVNPVLSALMALNLP